MPLDQAYWGTPRASENPGSGRAWQQRKASPLRMASVSKNPPKRGTKPSVKWGLCGPPLPGTRQTASVRTQSPVLSVPVSRTRVPRACGTGWVAPTVGRKCSRAGTGLTRCPDYSSSPCTQAVLSCQCLKMELKPSGRRWHSRMGLRVAKGGDLPPVHSAIHTQAAQEAQESFW